MRLDSLPFKMSLNVTLSCDILILSEGYKITERRITLPERSGVMPAIDKAVRCNSGRGLNSLIQYEKGPTAIGPFVFVRSI